MLKFMLAVLTLAALAPLTQAAQRRHAHPRLAAPARPHIVAPEHLMHAILSGAQVHGRNTVMPADYGNGRLLARQAGHGVTEEAI